MRQFLIPQAPSTTLEILTNYSGSSSYPPYYGVHGHHWSDNSWESKTIFIYWDCLFFVVSHKQNQGWWGGIATTYDLWGSSWEAKKVLVHLSFFQIRCPHQEYPKGPLNMWLLQSQFWWRYIWSKSLSCTFTSNAMV